jgi:hypothetical protein
LGLKISHECLIPLQWWLVVTLQPGNLVFLKLRTWLKNDTSGWCQKTSYIKTRVKNWPKTTLCQKPGGRWTQIRTKSYNNVQRSVRVKSWIQSAHHTDCVTIAAIGFIKASPAILTTCTNRHRCCQSSNSDKEGETHSSCEVIWEQIME